MNVTKNLKSMSNQQIRDLQERILNRCYGCGNKKAQRALRCKQYDETVAELVERLGETNSVLEIDADLAQNFSDAFKDENGCRPGAWAYKDAKEYMDRLYAQG